jgi:hypothetical protein
VKRAQVNREGFNPELALPYSLRPEDFAMAMDDVYVMLGNVNDALVERGLLPLESSVRGAIYSGLLSDLLTAALAAHALGLTKNAYPSNPHPDLLPVGRYPANAVKSAEEGVEVKVTKKPGGGVDMHGARPAWYAIFRYEADYETEPIVEREPTRFTHVWLAKLGLADFRRNIRGELGTPTSTPDRKGLATLRTGWLYVDPDYAASRSSRR